MSCSKRTGSGCSHFGCLLAASANEAHHDEVANRKSMRAEIHDSVGNVVEPKFRGVLLLDPHRGWISGRTTRFLRSDRRASRPRPHHHARLKGRDFLVLGRRTAPERIVEEAPES